jgi:hypothetical protein
MTDWTERAAAAREAALPPSDEPTGDIVPLRDLSEAAVTERLAALVAAGGSPRRAVKRLKAQGTTVTGTQLEALRDEHSGMYMALAAEMDRAQEEAIAQQLREIVVNSNRVTAAYVDHLAAEIEAGNMPKDIERTVSALAKVTQVGVDKLLAITGRPVSGQGADPLESARQLVAMGLLVPVERATIDGTAEDVST